MTDGLSILFSGSPLDRADPVRTDPERLAALQAEGRFLRLDGLRPVVEQGRLGWDGLPGAAAEAVFLGLGPDGRGHFAVVTAGLAGALGPADAALWEALALLPPEEVAIYGTARSLLNWHARHRFCSCCGGPTGAAKGGWQRDCPACGTQHFPRTDPVTIMIVEHEGRLLLGRQPRFAAGMYTALAGFVEPGETVEEAVAREVFEEAGVRVRDVCYVTSQPWPFPSSLMIACHAHADDAAITVDATELEDARWFTREEVTAALGGGEGVPFLAPAPRAVARQLLNWWVRRGPA
ncbi:NAD(+) diphosphatase [Novosphingobium flavum]|uniref:NAD(+) diphosphatase n=1 Tax=Novosphingobium flavum TaxID=1778672 RepID=A0A7X1FRW7_9SPHN|nr:NAD(+) diphosphatase [Novosphingobium flavum]MBC2665836.1 NAD(+) diphosphatase [Novosphingobium flavum]